MLLNIKYFDIAINLQNLEILCILIRSVQILSNTFIADKVPYNLIQGVHVESNNDLLLQSIFKFKSFCLHLAYN